MHTPKYNFPSGRPITDKPSNRYQYNRKTRQAIAIAKAQRIEQLHRRHILDLTIEELDLLLRSL
jgi:hypothetical protein